MEEPTPGYGFTEGWPRRLLLLPLVIAIFLPLACSSSDDGTPSASDESASIPVVEVPARWASAYANDLSTLTGWAPWAFVGEVVRLEEQRAVDLVPDDDGVSPEATVPGKPTPGRSGPPPFPVSYFEVRVQRALAGDLAAGKSVTVRQFGGLQQQTDGSTVRVQMERDDLLEPGKSYLFFVQPGEGIFQTAPFARMAVESDGTYAPLPGWSGLGALEQIGALSAAEAEQTIASIGTAP